MKWLIDKLRSSRVDAAIGQIERGEPVDWNKVADLQALDLVHSGELFLADRIEEEIAADERAIAECRERQN